jgi:hypothetical protein
MAGIRVTIEAGLGRSVHDSFSQFRKLAKDAGVSAQRDMQTRRTGGQNPELVAARAAHTEQSRLNREIMRQQIAAAKQVDAQNKQLARERTREELNGIRARQREERAATRERERDERRLASAQTSLDRQRGAALYRQFTARDREIDRFATRSSHRATRFIFPRPEGAIGYAHRTANDLLRGVGVDMSFGGGVARARERETAGMGLAQQERIATGKSQGGAFWAGKAVAVGDKLDVDPEKVTELMRAFTGKTGDFDAAAAKAQELASMTLASGANMGEMGSAAGYVYNQLKGMPDAAERTLDVMRGIVGQTAVGAVEMEEYAKQMGRVAANAKMFQGDVSKNILELSALTQLSIAEGGATSGADAARSIASFANTTSKGMRINAFKKQGVELFNESGTQKRPMLEIIKDSLIKSKGSIPEMTKMWADTLGQKPIRGLTNAFNAAGGGEKGWEAALAKINPFMDAQLGKEQERKNIQEYQQTTAAKAQRFQNNLDKITEAMAQRLIPAFESMAPTALKIAKAFGDFIAWATENPGKVVALAISACITRALTESFMRGLFERGIKGAVGIGTTGGGAGPGGGFIRNAGGNLTSAGGALTAGATGLAIGAGVYSAIDYAGKSNFDTGAKSTDEINAGLKNAHGEALGPALVEAKVKLKKLKADQGMFGDFLDLFGAGSGAEIRGSEDFLAKKRGEYEQWKATGGGKLSPETQKEIAAQQVVAGYAEKQKEIDAMAIGKATADGLKWQTLNVRVTNAGDIGKNQADSGPGVDPSGRAPNGKK